MRRLFAVAAAVLLSVPLLPAPALAHGQLAFSEPANQSTLAEPRPQVALYFTEKPASNAFFSITSPDGVRVEQGWTHGEPKPIDPPVQELNLVDGKWEPVFYRTGFPAMVGLSHWPSKGVYTVQYLSVASDGDKVSGVVRFDFQGATTAAPAGWQQPTNQADPALTGGHPAAPATVITAQRLPEASSSSSWPLWAGAAVLAVGIAGYFLLRRRRSVGGR